MQSHTLILITYNSLETIIIQQPLIFNIRVNINSTHIVKIDYTKYTTFTIKYKTTLYFNRKNMYLPATHILYITHL